MAERSSFYVFLGLILFGSFFFAGYEFKGREQLTATVAKVGSTNSASSSASSTPAGPTLADVLQELQDGQRQLAEQVADLHSELALANLKNTLKRVIQRGDSGDDVSKLQEFLQKIPDIYPPDIVMSSTLTGYYGYVTEIAVTKFQTQEGLKPTGIFDESTKNKLLDVATGIFASENAPVGSTLIDLSTVTDLQNLAYLQDLISQSVANASTTQSTVLDLQSQISQVASDLTATQGTIQDLENQITQMSSDIANLQTTPAIASPPPPAPTSTLSALSISNVAAINITQTFSTITWTTNRSSTSEVDYSQNSNLTNQVLMVTSSSFVTNHSLLLSQLSNNTKYYYRVVSKDSAGNIVSSTFMTFTTLH